MILEALPSALWLLKCSTQKNDVVLQVTQNGLFVKGNDNMHSFGLSESKYATERVPELELVL